MITKSTLSIVFFTLLSGSTAFAVETATRISDREIIESLAELKATQKAILLRFEDIMSATNRMFFGFVMSTLLALFGYIVWDRRTLMKTP